MTRMAKIAAAAIVLSTPAVAQVTTLQSDNPAPIKGDPNRTVCQVEQTTGSRLGARKVCKTVLEWQQMRTEHRETVEGFQQMGTMESCHDGHTICPH